MKLAPFALEEFWKKYEFSTPYHLCPSDAETWSLQEILACADSETKKLWNTLQLGYTESPGFPLLRKEIARLYENLAQDEILTTAGAEEGIYCTMQALLQAGDHVIVFTPCYQSLQAIPQAIGCEVSSIGLAPENGWDIPLDKLEKTICHKTKLIVLNIPHNPTGALLSRKTVQEILALAQKHDIYIFCDEVYRFLEIDETMRLASFADAYERAISLNVMTKSFGLAGLRIGWLACKDKGLLEKISAYKLYTSICNSAPSEILALIALRAKNLILHRNRSIMLNNLQVLDTFFSKYPETFLWKRPQSGCMAFVELLLAKPIDQFTEELVQQVQVLIMPATVFDFKRNFFRIGFGKKNMPDVLQRFEQFVVKNIV